MVKSIAGTSSTDLSLIPQPFASDDVWRDVVTPTISNPSRLIRSANFSMKNLTVEPVPRPTIMPSVISEAAYSPAWRFCSVIRSMIHPPSIQLHFT